MNTHEEYLEALDAFLDREMDPQKAAEMGLLAARVAPFGAYIQDALAIRAAFPGIGDVSVPAGFAESVLALLPEQTGGAPEAADSPREASQSGEAERGASQSGEAERETSQSGEASRISEADTQAIVEEVARLAAAAYAEERKAASTDDPNRAESPDRAGRSDRAESPDHTGGPDGAESPDKADNLNRVENLSRGDGLNKMDDWKEKWKKAALPLAACVALVLLVAGGFVLSRGGGTPPAADNSDKGAAVAAASDGTESPSISLGAGAAEFKRMEEEAEASLQDSQNAAEAREESAPAETETAKEEAPPTPAPTEAPRQPSPTPSPKPSPTPTPVPTPTEAPPTPEPEPEPDAAANVPAQNGAGEEVQSTENAGTENPWDNVELTLPDDAGYLFERYTPLEEEAGGALYAFSREQYAALLDSLDAAGFITHTSMPSGSGTIYVYLETDGVDGWEEGLEEGSEGEAETEPDFDPEEGTEIAASGNSEVEEFARR